jgi:hypothetical protein
MLGRGCHLDSENMQALHKDVHKLRGHQSVQDTHITYGYAFLHEVEVISTCLVLNEVGEEVDGTDVVAVDECALRQWCMKLLK